MPRPKIPDEEGRAISTLAERLLSKCDRSSECWLWMSSRSGSGYGRLNRQAHRVSYELHRGPIPPGLVIDHLCRVRLCVNPDHLEAVTQRENILRGKGIAARLYRGEKIPAMRRPRLASACGRGHAMTPVNSYRRPSGRVECRTCRQAAKRGVMRQVATRP